MPASKTRNMNCTNVFYCQNGQNCTEISVCKKNDSCSLIEKCDQVSGQCSMQDMCKPVTSLLEKNRTLQANVTATANETGSANSTANQTNGTAGGGGNATDEKPPVQTKTPEEIKEARDRLDQLRSHLDVTALFLGQDNVGKILAKLEMDAADPPIPQSKMGDLFQKC